MKIAVVTVTEQGDKIAEILSVNMEIDLYSKKRDEDFDFKVISKKVMEEYPSVIFISSTGIAVRAIAPYIVSKDKDPAVVVVDNSGNFVISLLSGHLGGANELTVRIAEVLKAQPIITTATDNLGIIAPDMIAKENRLIIDDLKNAKYIASLLVAGKKVAFIDEDKKIELPKGYTRWDENVDGVVYVTNKVDFKISLEVPTESVYSKKHTHNYDFKEENLNYINNHTDSEKIRKNGNIKSLKLIRKNIILGIGCRRDFSSDKMKYTVLRVLKENNIDERAVKGISTVEVKKDEKAIIDLAEYFHCDLNIFTVEEIKKVHNKYIGSDFVEKTIGVRAVSEPCVELSGGIIIENKMKLDGMTLCIGHQI